MSRFEPEKFLETIQQHKVTILNLVPPIVLFLAKHPLVEKYNLKSLRVITSGAAPLGSDLQSAAIKRLGIPINQGFGMTETSPATLLTPMDVPVVGSCGKKKTNITSEEKNLKIR